jgi:protein disulfide-isomerase
MIVGCLGFGLTTLAAEEWNTDLPTARARAGKEKKLVLVDFTGSDWCSWCKRLQKEVFSTKEFGDFAKDNLVLVEIDFPSQKKQNDSLKKANEALKNQYRVEGFPTIVVLDGDGKELWRQVGYLEGGPKAWIGKIRPLKKG